MTVASRSTRVAAGVTAGAVALGALAVVSFSYDTWSALLILAALILVALLALSVPLRSEKDRRIRVIVHVSLALKLIAGFGQYLAAGVLYGGTADAENYHDRGALLAVLLLAEGDFVAPQRPIPGTGFVDLLVGFAYTVTGPSRLGAYLLFSWLGFWGLFLCFRAFTTAFPHSDRLLYATVVLLLPSLLFWPSTIGKEAWMLLALGASAYGAARLYAGAPRGLLWLGVGVVAGAMVRPHIALAVCVAVTVGYLVQPGGRARGGGVGKAVLLTGLLVGSLGVLSQVESFFGVGTVETESLTDVLSSTTDRTDRGGSAFTSTSAGSIAGFPVAVVTVIFRPLPYEASSALALLASIEGLVLLVLFAVKRRQLRRLSRAFFQHPYIAFCATYSALFIFAFSSFSNFGVLTRQRVQVFPFILVLIAVPALRARGAPSDAGRAPRAASGTPTATGASVGTAAIGARCPAQPWSRAPHAAARQADPQKRVR